MCTEKITDFYEMYCVIERALAGAGHEVGNNKMMLADLVKNIWI